MAFSAQMPIIIIACSFLTAAFFLLGVLKMTLGRRASVAERLKRIASDSPEAYSTPVREEKKKSPGLRGWFKQASRVFSSFSYARSLEKEMIRADLPLRGEEFLFLLVCTALFLPLLVWFLTSNIGLTVVLGLAGLTLPFLWLRQAKRKRIERFNEQMGSGLSILTNSLRAGYSFLQAVELVSQESPSPLADEFGLLMREIKLGVTTEEALYHLGERVPSPDLELLITAVVIQRQLGGNLAEIIDNISHTIRERIRIKGEVKTLTAQGRISGIIIGLLPIAIIAMIFVINPQYMSLLFTHPWGRFMIAYGVVSEFIGIMIVRKVVNVEV
ncbi:MAG: type II secretion system F family protein [Firmicutes bacterium]|nr:type II secretion system F family protein [Bacillota bacterium]